MMNTQCDYCPTKYCSSFIPGRGSLTSSLMLIGDYPKVEDEVMQEPFSGLEGTFLKKFFSIDKVYMTNAVKCLVKPPDKYSAKHIFICKAQLWDEIRTIQPKVIITLGKIPSALLLHPKVRNTSKMSEVVGKFNSVSYINSLIVPWYHPNYILNQGKELMEKTICFFKEVKIKCNL